MNDLGYEYSQDGVWLNSFNCAFLHKKVRCANETEIKDRLQYTNKKRLYNLSDELETLIQFLQHLSSWSFICKKHYGLLETFFENKCFGILKI